MTDTVFRQVRRDLFCGYREGKMVAYAHFKLSSNYIDTLWVAPDCRRQGIATGLVTHMADTLKRPMHRCPDRLKNDAVRGLSAKLGDKLGPEAR